MRRRAFPGLLWSVVLVAGVLLPVLMAPAAGASVSKPFAITKFALQTIKGTREVPLHEPFEGGEHYEFFNEPETFTQAGGHPWGLTTTIEFASEEVNKDIEGGVVTKGLEPTRDPKDIVVDLPPGFLGDPQAVPRCPLSQLVDKGVPCPADTQIGVVDLHGFGGTQEFGPIVNLVPEKGQSAEFGLENPTRFTYLLTGHVVRTASGYGLTVVTNEIPQVELTGVDLTFWGVPGDPSHDQMRGRFCESGAFEAALACTGGKEPFGYSPETPFLTMQSDCAAGPQAATMRADSWEEPGHVGVNGQYEGYTEAPPSMFPGMTGCNLLSFDSSVEVHPDTVGADEPVGLGVDLKVPQVLKPEAPEAPQLRNTVLTLPEGLSISPGIVDGIQACNESGPEGINFTGPESEEVGDDGELQLAAGHCPQASTVGTAEAVTPLLGVPVKGHLYLARPLCGGAGQEPCTEQDALDGRLYRLYLELGGTGALADTGVNLKVALDTEANPATGQLTAVAENTPQLPFSELKIHLNGGPRSPLDNPAVCGPATSTASLTPWSAPGITPEGLSMPGTPAATPSSSYDVEGCAGAPGLHPGLVAGMATPQAAQFSAFTLNLTRQDREQFVNGIQVHTPPGLLGMLSSVPLCAEAQAQAGTCPEASKIGTTRVASGAGSHPFEIEGNVYLTEKYDGAPFGLSIVTNAVAGPFNLGLVVVRARIDVNPEDSSLTITTDETGPHAVPQILDGVPLRLKQIAVDIDRPDFMFNPTNCDTQQITAVVSGSENAKTEVQSPLVVGGCKTLAFKPTFAVSTSGKTSKADGASLDAKLSYPAGSLGSEANIAKVKVDLPKQLPSRLTTLQKACTAKTFEADPANCPSASIVGIVKANTPLLPVELSGPVYFVSHGGEAFPSLIVVLQGDGVRVDLTGSTFISHAGITSSTFKTVPDVPVNTFEIYLPEGKYSALAANGNLCTSKLTMPTALTAQNGLEIHQTTKISVTDCPKAKQAKAKRRKQKHKRSTSGHGRTSK